MSSATAILPRRVARSTRSCRKRLGNDAWPPWAPRRRRSVNAILDPRTLRSTDPQALGTPARRARAAMPCSRIWEDARVRRRDRRSAGRAANQPAARRATAAARLAQLARWELTACGAFCSPPGIPMIALKGVACIVRAIPHAATRILSDIDVMVPRDRIDDAEAALLAGGWKGTKLDPYDQRYYRRWSHEIPPLSYPGRLLGVDVHHTICPPRSRLRPRSCAVLGRCRARGRHRRSGAVCGRQRAAFGRAFVLRLGFRRSLPRLGRPARIVGGVRQARGILAGADRACAGATAWDARFHYAFATLSTVLRTPIPRQTLRDARAFKPNPVTEGWMRKALEAVLTPIDPARWPPATAAAYGCCTRSHWLRMPAYALVPHLLRKIGASRRRGCRRSLKLEAKKARVAAGLFAAKCRIPATRSVGA